MTHDPLFDPAAPPDPEITRLEDLLSPYRSRPPKRVWPAATALALAAIALLAVGLSLSRPVPWSTSTASCSGCIWEPDTLLDTSIEATARIGHRGELRAAPGSSIRRDAHNDAHFTVDRGQVAFLVDAPARWLVVRIPGVDVVDLGCAYTLDVAPTGTSVVEVQSGAVALEGGQRPSLVYAGMMAATWPDGRTGLPVVVDASKPLISAVDAFDRGQGGLTDLLQLADLNDAITLWHLIARVPATSRLAVVERLESVLGDPLPSRDGLLDLDSSALDISLAYIIGRTL